MLIHISTFFSVNEKDLETVESVSVRGEGCSEALGHPKVGLNCIRNKISFRAFRRNLVV